MEMMVKEVWEGLEVVEIGQGLVLQVEAVVKEGEIKIVQILSIFRNLI
jgi:hypothetical protein